MKKVLLFALLLSVILCGLPGCTTSRATVKTDTERQARRTEVTDSSRTEKTDSRQQLTAVLSSSEQKTVVIEFEEWEYYPDFANTTAQGSAPAPELNRRTSDEADKPPNAGAVKRHKKGTITINADRQTTGTTEQASETVTDTSEAGSREATLDEAEKEKTSTKQQDRKGRVWFYVGLLCAVLLIATGIYLARRK